MKLGEGTFGTVLQDPKNKSLAIKKLTERSHFLQEIVLNLYMRDSEYTVKLVSYSIYDNTITMARWHSSLRDAQTSKMSHRNKMSIYKDVLLAISHLQSRGILHSDLKSSNILVNSDFTSACVCDLGLSSLTLYAKILQTALAYRPNNAVPTAGHDMFGMCVTMAELFGGVRARTRNAAELRTVVSRNVKDAKVMKSLVAMVPDNPVMSAHPDEILGSLFHTKSVLKLKPFVKHPHVLPETILNYMWNTIETLTDAAHINRGRRCYCSLVIFLENPAHSNISSKMYPIYIAAMLMIFSATFGSPGFTESQALKATSTRFTMESLLKALNKIISDQNTIKYIMVPSS